MTFEVSQANRDLFAREGYMILPVVIPANLLISTTATAG